MENAKNIAFDKETLLQCKGYDAYFIDGKTNVSLHTVLNPTQRKNLRKVEGNTKRVLNYTDFSVLYNHDRRLPFFTAYNIDGVAEKIKTKRVNFFSQDPRIYASTQLNQSFYNLITGFSEFEIGHMAANNELSWGENAQLRAYQSFHFTNTVPQVERLNAGLWRSLESYILGETSQPGHDQKICVFSGPFIKENDPFYIQDQTFQIPLFFYKVIVFGYQKKIYSTAFVMSQEKRLKELNLIFQHPDFFERKTTTPDVFNDFKYKKVFQVNISFLEEHTGLSFSWRKVNPLVLENDILQLEKIKNISSAGDVFETSSNTMKLNMVLPNI